MFYHFVETLETYSHVVGVDVIWAHNIWIGVLQDDPGVIDLGEREHLVYAKIRFI